MFCRPSTRKGHKAKGTKKRSPFVRSMATLISSSAVAQIITIVVAPITTRLFSPEELGVYTLVISSVTMFGAVLSLRYDMSIVYEEDERNVHPLVVLSTRLCLATSLLVSIGYFFYFAYFSGTGYSAWAAALFTFIQCALFGLVNVLNAYNNRKCQYGIMSAANVERTLFQNLAIVGTGLAHLGATGLIAAQSLGYAFGVKRQATGLYAEREKLREVRAADLKRVGRKHKKQALWSAPAAFANGFAYSVINYFIEYLYSATTVGFYSVSYRVLGLPTNVIAQNISRVFAERAARDKQSDGNFLRIYKKTLAMMVAMSVPVAIVLVLVAPQLFGFVFGEGWEVAGTYVQILTPMFVLRFIAGGLNTSAMISGKQHWDLIVQLMLVVSMVGSFFVSLTMGLEIEGMLELINWVSSAIYVFYIGVFWYCARC